MEEWRKHIRNRIKASVKLSHSKIGDVYARSRDISDGGIFVEAEGLDHLPKGAHIEMQFLDSANPDITFNMKVVRIRPDGLGLCFVDYEIDGQRFKIKDLKMHWKARSSSG